MARSKLKGLLAQYPPLKEQLEQVWMEVETTLKQIPRAKEMSAIKRVGKVTVALFFAEIETYKTTHTQIKY